MADVTVTGFAEVDARLQALASGGDKIARKALRAGAKIVLENAKNTIPVQSGASRRALRIVTRNKKGFSKANVVVGGKWFTGKEFYFAFAEFGHKIGSRKLGNARKELKGEHSLQHAFEEVREAATLKIFATVGVLLDKVAAGGKP